MNQNIRMINYRELYFRISNFRISTFRKSNDKKTGFVQRALFLFFSISCALLFSFGCKPQRIISEGVVSENMVSQSMVSESIVSQTDNSSVLQLKDSLRIMETQIAFLESDLKRAREENFNLRSETLMYEVNYDTNTTVDSITKRPAVIREVYTVSKKLYEETVREYKTLLQEASIEIKNISTRNSNLKLINESLEKENLELMSERNSKSESSSMSKSNSKSGFKYKIIIAVVILIIVIKYVRKN
jgi:hypothetical protein